jgi:hypothetical protein
MLSHTCPLLCLFYPVRVSLDAMVAAGVTVALISKTSCGIYAGVHRERINSEFGELVNELLQVKRPTY